MRYRSSAMLAMLLLPALLFCAPGGAVNPPQDAGRILDTAADAFPIHVTHNAPVVNSFTIFLSDGMGARRLLGTVAPSRTETFIIEHSLAPGPYRLIAEGIRGRAITSRLVHLTTRDGVRWLLSTNTITSLPGDEPQER